MQSNSLSYGEAECPWCYFDNSYKILLGSCLIVVGVFGVLLNGWLFITFLHSHLLTHKSHLLILNLCSASLGRNLLSFPFIGASVVGKRWIFGPACCQLFAFINQFHGVFQMSAIMVLVLERYLLAKYYILERKLCMKLYWTLICACWLTSATFAAPPLFGYGVYACDPTRTSCSLLWPSTPSDAKQLAFYVLYVVVCGILPVVVIFYYIRKAVRLEKNYYRNEMQKEHKRLTKTIYAAIIITFGLWTPAAVFAAWQWLSLVLGDSCHLPPTLALLAPIAAEAATSVPVLCYLYGDDRLRAALLGRMQRNYALLTPDFIMRYKNLLE